MIPDQEINKQFSRSFLSRPTWTVRAPGRVNLIGEHTDYNGGLVFPAAIQYEMKIGAALSNNHIVTLVSGNYHQICRIDMRNPLTRSEDQRWVNYFLAVMAQFQDRDIDIPGLDVFLKGDVPLGSGLSSSAAYEVCVATLLNEVTQSGLSKKEIALLSQKAEHSTFVGVRCGIMDQFISALGAKDHALKVDCYDLNYELVPFDSAKASIVIINSMKKRGLVDSEYNQRRIECETGLTELKRLSGTDYPSLRHIPMDIFNQYADQLPPLVQKRVKHNLTENQRVMDFAEALKNKDFPKAGEILYGSHTSLKDDFQVSCKELDIIVEIARNCEGVYGCRMTGGGFGGCAVALVQPDKTEAFIDKLTPIYRDKTNLDPVCYISPPAAGASINSPH